MKFILVLITVIFYTSMLWFITLAPYIYMAVFASMASGFIFTAILFLVTKKGANINANNIMFEDWGFIIGGVLAIFFFFFFLIISLTMFSYFWVLI